MSVEKSEVKALVKEAILATDSVQYPDLLMYLANRMLREPLDEVLQTLEKKDMIERFSDDMGTVITKTKKKKKG